MQPVSAPGDTQMLVVQDSHAGIRQGYPAGVSKILGAIQISIGAACIILQVISIALKIGLYPIGHGIWCGLFFILAGSFGVAARSKRTGLIITSLVLSIIAVAIFVWPVIGCGVADHLYSEYQLYHRPNATFDYIGASEAIGILMILLGIVEGIIAIIASAICCGPLCCQNQNTQIMYATPAVQQPYMMTGALAAPEYNVKPPMYNVQPGYDNLRHVNFLTSNLFILGFKL